jgi:hypothetical protein
VLCNSSMRRINASRLITCPVSSLLLATICLCLIILPAQCTRSWFSEYLVVVPQLTGLNDLLVRRATDAAALTDHVTYLTLRCCSIFVLTSLAQIYDIIARSPITLYESLKFRGICDETLRDLAKITVDFTKDDYSYLEPLLTVSPLTTCICHGAKKNP